MARKTIRRSRHTLLEGDRLSCGTLLASRIGDVWTAWCRCGEKIELRDDVLHEHGKLLCKTCRAKLKTTTSLALDVLEWWETWGSGIVTASQWAKRFGTTDRTFHRRVKHMQRRHVPLARCPIDSSEGFFIMGHSLLPETPAWLDCYLSPDLRIPSALRP